MKRIHWHFVMFAALVFMFMGLGLSLWAIDHHNVPLALTGLVTISVVCVSWWFWVMFIIKTMITQNDKLCDDLIEIKDGVREFRVLFKDYYDPNNDK